MYSNSLTVVERGGHPMKNFDFGCYKFSNVSFFIMKMHYLYNEDAFKNKF